MTRNVKYHINKVLMNVISLFKNKLNVFIFWKFAIKNRPKKVNNLHCD